MKNTTVFIAAGIALFAIIFALFNVSPSPVVNLKKMDTTYTGIEKFYHDFETKHPNWKNNSAVKDMLVDTLVNDFTNFVNHGGMDNDSFVLDNVSKLSKKQYLVQYSIGSSLFIDKLYHLDFFSVVDEEVALSLKEKNKYVIKPSNIKQLSYQQIENIRRSMCYSPFPSISECLGGVGNYGQEGKMDLTLGCYMGEIQGGVCSNPKKHIHYN